MSLLKDFSDLDENGKLGDWCFINGDSYICLRYPREGDGFEEGDIIVLPISQDVNAPQQKHWDWNGSKDAPTLSPSIGVGKAPYIWHGYLREGKLVNA